MRVNRLALGILLAGAALLCVFGYSLTQNWKVEAVEKVPVYNFDGEQIGYVEMPKTVHTAWCGIGALSLIVGLIMVAEGFVFLRPDDP